MGKMDNKGKKETWHIYALLNLRQWGKIYLIVLLLLLNYKGSCNIENITFSVTDEDTLSLITTELKYPGVVVILPDSYEYLKEEILIRNENGSIVNKLYFDEKELMIDFEKGTPSIREYDPDYHVIIFDGYPLENNKYKVIIDNSIFFLDHVEGYTVFRKWEEHITRAFILTNELNPLRETPTESGKIIPMDYNNSNFISIEVKNDWVKVECDTYEGCPDGKLVTGWLRWRKGNELLVELRYAY